MRDARERRLEGVEPRYPRDLPALRRTLIIVDYDFGRSSIVSMLYVRRGLIVTGRSADGWEWKRPRRLVEGCSPVSRQVPPRTRSLIFDVGLLDTSGAVGE